MAELTPMKKQYNEVKAQYPDCLLFFRLGDFYEMFDEDAQTAASELGLTLTTRDRTKPEGQRTPMCGVPYHSAETYISRLIAKGYKVAICEQQGDPAQTKGLVGREVIRVVTPGTIIEESMLEEGQNNFLAALWVGESGTALCFGDLSTGEVLLTSFPREDWQTKAVGELSRYLPREVLLSPEAADEAVLAFLKERTQCRVEYAPEACFDLMRAQRMAERQFPTGLSQLPPGPGPAYRALGGLMTYFQETQKTDLSYINRLRYYETSRFLLLDPAARRNLELTETLRGKEKKGSLLWVLDETRTPMGGRLLRSWLERPLLDPREISQRLQAVDWLKGHSVEREELTRLLREVTDLERLISRVVYGSAGGRDLVALAAGLSYLPSLQRYLPEEGPALLVQLRAALAGDPALWEEIQRAIVDEPPVSVREGGLIRTGYHVEVDELRDILADTKGYIARMEAAEKEKTGIKTLKIGFNKVFGYYIEVSKSYTDQVPEDYIRKQTLVGGERYITQELKEMESTMLSAQSRITALEYQLFCDLRGQTADRAPEIQCLAAAAAQVDVLACLATVAAENNYCMPQVSHEDGIEIIEGRHPVVEKMRPDIFFVPNDTRMDTGENLAAIITGPNMAGKSTYMRQVALIVLMAQMGSFVPARSAKLGVVDRIFTRIGASDDLAGGQSTFMIEMMEVAELLKNATSRSLLILDEIGRGTSTYDGMAIARAVLEHCADRKKLGAKTLFATHYHELTALEEQLPGVKNFNIAAQKRLNQVLFLRKILPGGADQSYGIEVAGLAGVPPEVIGRARDILEELEAQRPVTLPAPSQTTAAEDESVAATVSQKEKSLPALSPEEAAVLQALRETAIDSLTPLQALNLLSEWKGSL